MHKPIDVSCKCLFEPAVRPLNRLFIRTALKHHLLSNKQTFHNITLSHLYIHQAFGSLEFSEKPSPPLFPPIYTCRSTCWGTGRITFAVNTCVLSVVHLHSGGSTKHLRRILRDIISKKEQCSFLLSTIRRDARFRQLPAQSITFTCLSQTNNGNHNPVNQHY